MNYHFPFSLSHLYEQIIDIKGRENEEFDISRTEDWNFREKAFMEKYKEKTGDPLYKIALLITASALRCSADLITPDMFLELLHNFSLVIFQKNTEKRNGTVRQVRYFLRNLKKERNGLEKYGRDAR